MRRGTRPLLLIADDDPISRTAISAACSRDFEILKACNGAEAVDMFESKHPDMVLMDMEMPNMDGLEATQLIKRSAGDRYVPVIVLSSHGSGSDVVRGLEAGADDYIVKPCDRAVLNAKLAVFTRLQAASQMLSEQNEQLSAFRRSVVEDHEVAEQVLGRILRSGCANPDFYRFKLSSLAVFNGDVTLAGFTPAGGFRVMLADMAGHGLSGALGTVPLAMVFLGTTSKGISLRESVATMDEKLHFLLPTGLFASACIFELSPTLELSVINAGTPDVLVRNVASGAMTAFPASRPPLGIGTNVPSPQSMKLQTGDNVFACSDGISERSDPEGVLFGSQRLRQAVEEAPSDGFLADIVLSRATQFARGLPARDDVSIAEIITPTPAVLRGVAMSHRTTSADAGFAA